jgi:hypothetical protein
MAAIQIALIIVGLRVARQVSAAAEDVRREVRPLVEKVNRIADDAARTTSLVAIQAERVDQFVATTITRVDDALGVLQFVVSKPARQGAAAIAAFKAALAVVRHLQGHRRPARDDEDPLFVG